nr:LemA family protein [Moraxella pluranimalium]
MKTMKKQWLMGGMLAMTLGLSGCGYNAMQAQDEEINASWSEVVNQYQRRADLVPNLVATVERYAKHEEKVFTEVAEARAKVGSVQITPETLNDPQAMANYQAAQSQMTSALSRLMMVSENYPELKADAAFQDLQAQLEGTENRITVARNRYIENVKVYNTTVRQFPTNITAKVFGMSTKPNFGVENEQAISTAPKVEFGGDNKNSN